MTPVLDVLLLASLRPEGSVPWSKSRLPCPITTGKIHTRNSSIRLCFSSVWIRSALPWTCSSGPSSCLSFATSSATSSTRSTAGVPRPTSHRSWPSCCSGWRGRNHQPRRTRFFRLTIIFLQAGEDRHSGLLERCIERAAFGIRVYPGYQPGAILFQAAHPICEQRPGVDLSIPPDPGQNDLDLFHFHSPAPYFKKVT